MNVSEESSPQRPKLRLPTSPSEIFLSGIGTAEGIDREIHPSDAMYRFALRLCHGAPGPTGLEYFRSGLAAAQTVQQLVDWRFGDKPPGSVLEFGCGHGRMTRFLARLYGDERMVAAEVDPTAVDFVRRFGVEAIQTTIEPASLAPGEGFDVLLAYSVLSHLPAGAFEGWLNRWWEHLAPGGLLVASVLDEAVLLPGRAMPSSGFWFEPVSESECLDLDDYGTTWVTEAFMRQACETLDDVARVERLPLGLWHLQDLWALVKGPLPENAPLPSPPPVAPGPAGYLESLTYDSNGFSLGGWALTHSGKTLVEARLDGVSMASARPTEPRADVGPMAATGPLNDPLHPAGFRLDYTQPSALDPTSFLEVAAVDSVSGARHVLHLDRLESTDLFLRLRKASLEAEQLRDQVEVFEASGFGRLRRQWMRWIRGVRDT